MTFLQRFSKTDSRHWVAFLLIFGAITFLFALLIFPIPHENKDLVNTSIGFVFGAGVSGVVGYYFGSSKTNKIDEE